jgi:hypothetical protein
MATNFLRQMSEQAWPELDAFLECMVIMLTCDGSYDPRELDLFSRIGADLQRYHIPTFGAIDLKDRYDRFVERLQRESVGRRLDAIATALPTRPARMMALFFAMKISSADLRLVPAERDMLHKMQTHFKLSDADYNEVRSAYKKAVSVS